MLQRFSRSVRILQTIMNSFEGGQSCDNNGCTSAKLSRTLSGHQESSGTTFSLGFVTKIELENFMCHSSFVVEPGPCINLITGRNGAGKSSMIQVHWIAYFPESISNTEFFINYRIHLTHEENFQENPQFFGNSTQGRIVEGTGNSAGLPASSPSIINFVDGSRKTLCWGNTGAIYCSFYSTSLGWPLIQK